MKNILSFFVWNYLAFVGEPEIVIYSAEDETTALTPNYLLNSGQHVTNLYDYIANSEEEKLSFYSCFQLPEMGAN